MSGFKPAGGLSPEQEGAVDSIVNLDDGSIPKADNGELVESSTVENSTTKEWLFNKSIEVPQASIQISDPLSISEATTVVITRDKVRSKNVVSVSSDIDSTNGSSKLNFDLAPSSQVVTAQPDFGTSLTSNPLVVPLLATRANQTNIVTLKTGSVMNNFRATIVDNTTGLTLKYIPSKEAVDSGVGGLDLPVGNSVFNFNDDLPDNPTAGLFYLGFTPLRQFQGQASTLNIFADSVDILGEPGGIPFIINDIHFLSSTTVPFIEDVTNLVDSYTRLNNENTNLSGVTSGIAVTYLATSTIDTVSSGQFTSGVLTSSNPSVETVGDSTFSQNDLVQINNTILNDGLYEVEDHTGTLLSVRGVGVVDNVEGFTSSDFITTVDSGNITKVNISVIRAGVDGKWESGKGSATPLTFVDIDIFGSEYQFESDESESTTTSQTFVNKLTLTTPTIPAGSYRGEITCAVTNDSSNKIVVIETSLDGDLVNESSYSPKAGGEFLVKTSFSNDTITDGVHTLDLNFKAGSTGGTAKIKNARIEIFRVS